MRAIESRRKCPKASCIKTSSGMGRIRSATYDNRQPDPLRSHPLLTSCRATQRQCQILRKIPMTFEFILTTEHDTDALRVGVVTLNRSKQLNALSDSLMDELGAALRAYDADDRIGCIVITGSERAFAAGADIPTIARMGFMQAYQSDLISRNWETLCEIRKPVIAAVAGLALGGGCELAMMCDFIIAAD